MTPGRPRRRILWTGGFDSTWLVVDALLNGELVEAVTWRGYGMNPAHWQKPANEDAAKRRILHRLGPLADRVGQLEGSGYPYRDVHESWAKLTDAASDRWFSQQDMILGALPQLTGGPLEAGFVRDEANPVMPWRVEVLSSMGLEFPILQMSKPELLEDARHRGFADILAMTWSCEGNAGGKLKIRTEPCGECDPCRHRILAQHGWMVAG